MMKRWVGLGMVLAGALVFAMGVTAGDSKSVAEGSCPMTKAANAGGCSGDANSKASAETLKACPVMQAEGAKCSEKKDCCTASQNCTQCPAAGSCEQAVKAASADVPACFGEKAVKSAAADSCCASITETASADSSSTVQKDASLVAVESK